MLPLVLASAAAAAAPPPPPLAPLAFQPLPLGAIRPRGWLLSQLEAQADGLSGHMGLFWEDITNSVWLNGTYSEGDGLNEDLPYWANGFVPLAFLLRDERPQLLAQLEGTLDRIVAAQAADGWLGPRDRPTGDGDRYWRQYPLLLALTQYAEAAPAAQSARLVDAIRRFLHGFARWIEVTPVDVWSAFRWQDMALTIFWMLDNHPGGEESFLLELATTLSQQGFDWGKSCERPPTPTLRLPRPDPRLLFVGPPQGSTQTSATAACRRWPATARLRPHPAPTARSRHPPPSSSGRASSLPPSTPRPGTSWAMAHWRSSSG